MGVIIKDIKKSNNEIIRVEVSEFQGRDLINIRIWYPSIDNSSGDVTYKPTQKGVTLQVHEYAELKDAVDRLGNFIEDSKKGTSPEQFEESQIEDETPEEE